MNNFQRQIVTILFSDLVGYSSIKNDNLYVKVNEIINEFFRRSLNDKNNFFKNTWGDGIVICSYDPNDLLEIALELRDFIINKNWKRLEFKSDLKIRIGLHAEKVNVIYENEKVVNVMGENINTASRIEPIVEDNKIFCSEMFYQLVKSETEGFVSFNSLGERKLAKDYGAMELYCINNNSVENIVEKESKEKHITNDEIIPVKIRKKYSDIDKDNFLKENFEYICDYFDRKLRILEKQESEIEISFERIRIDKMISKIYVQGENRAECQIWIARNFTNGINYSTKIDNYDNSCNESLSVYTDEFSLYLKAMGMLSYGQLRNEKLNKESASIYLWEQFIKKLEY